MCELRFIVCTMNRQIICCVLLAIAYSSQCLTQEILHENDTKIFVHPITNEINYIKPPQIKPTTHQVVFEPGVPPSSTSPSVRPSRPTRPPRPTRPTRITSSTTRTTYRTRSTKAHYVTNAPHTRPSYHFENRPAVTEASSSSSYPPGVSPPEPIVSDPDRGVVNWLLGLVGFKPDEQDSHRPPTGSKGCSKCTCGMTYKHNRIIGGIETKVNEYPWMVILMSNGRYYCGASVINNKYCLTAAHCVNGVSKERLLAVFLDHDRSTTSEAATFTRRISKIIAHSSYGTGGTFNNDIALLQLEQPLDFNGLLRPVCLPPLGKSYSGSKGIVTGWGVTKVHGVTSSKLLEVTVPILSNRDCRRTGYGARITDNMICAGYPQGQKDACQGDSGGPLHVQNGSYHEQIGIVSWGESCAEPNYPGVYARVNRYITWIYSNTKDACYC